MGILKGKKFLIVGAATNRSIASGIANSFFHQGAELCFTYLDNRFENRVRTIANACNSNMVYKCNVSSDDEIELLFKAISERWEKFDGIVHSVAFAPVSEMKGNYLDDVTRDGFKTAHDISSYSFTALAKAALPYMNNKSSLITISFLGAVRAMPFYNVMGLAKASLESNVRYMAFSLGSKDIRVNAISSGPVKTMSTSGIKNFNQLLSSFEETAPLKRNVTLEDVGNAAVFLASDLSSGVTGQILYVDNGFNIIAFPDSKM